MERNRIAGILLVVAGSVFLAAGILEREGSGLRFVAAALLIAAGVLRLARTRPRV